MVNVNGTLTENTTSISVYNRGLNYGDAVFETVKYSAGKLLFWEDHYFRFMASMRILRMEIPMDFTMEYLREQIFETIEANGLKDKTARVKLLVFRNDGGKYNPETNGVGFVITVSPLDADFYLLNTEPYTVDLYKDFYVAPGLLSTLKTNNKALHVTGSIYASENGWDNCLMLNTNKSVVEALNGNLFLVKGNTIKTPPLEDGCLKGIMRKQLMEIVEQLPDYAFEEASVSPFELQKADEMFITNVITGIQPVSQYRKKTYGNDVAKMLLQKLNVKVRLVSQ